MALADRIELNGPRPRGKPAGRSYFYDPRVRSIVFQVATALAVVAFIVWVADNTIQNLLRSNIASGFGFLDARSGFDISQTIIPY